MRIHSLLAATATLALLTAGCAGTDSGPFDTGERISQRGDDIGAYGTAWSDGQEDVKQGRKSIEKSTRSLAEGERDLERARTDIAKAEQQIADATAAKSDGERQVALGNSRMQRAEADYDAIQAGPSAVTDSN